jgi:hypothetical protein
MSKEFTDSSEFVVSSPDLQVGLSMEIEPGTRPKEFLNRYDAADKVRCAFCKGHTPHHRGFTVRLDDGRTALCGIICAQDFFGKEVASRFESVLQQQIERHNQKRILARTVDGAASALAIMENDWLEIERAYCAAVGGIKAWIELDDVKRDLAGDSILLRKTKTKWVDTVARDGREIRKKETYDEVHAKVQGGKCLLTTRKAMGLAKGGLSSLASKAEHPELIKGKKITELMNKRRAIIELIEEGVGFVRSAHAFFQESNIAEFQKWYRYVYTGDQPKIEIRPDNQLLISHPEPRGLPVVVCLPRVLPDPQPLHQLLSSTRGVESEV